jgi:hypothetical protein
MDDGSQKGVDKVGLHEQAYRDERKKVGKEGLELYGEGADNGGE